MCYEYTVLRVHLSEMVLFNRDSLPFRSWNSNSARKGLRCGVPGLEVRAGLSPISLPWHNEGAIVTTAVFPLGL